MISGPRSAPRALTQNGAGRSRPLKWASKPPLQSSTRLGGMPFTKQNKQRTARSALRRRRVQKRRRISRCHSDVAPASSCNAAHPSRVPPPRQSLSPAAWSVVVLLAVVGMILFVSPSLSHYIYTASPLCSALCSPAKHGFFRNRPATRPPVEIEHRDNVLCGRRTEEAQIAALVTLRSPVLNSLSHLYYIL